MKLSYLALLLVTAGLLRGDDDERTRISLKRLKGVHVLIGNLSAVFKENGLTETQVRTDAELKLRLAGIPVLSKEEAFKVPGTPTLYIRVIGQHNADMYAFSTRVALLQDVRLLRDPSIVHLGASTWDTAGLGTVGQVEMRSFVRDTIKDKVDIFINAYLSVNPKK